MSETILATDKEAIGALKDIGVKAKSWRNSDGFAPPADVNYRGELRVHTGGQPVLVATDTTFHQAIMRPTRGMFEGSDFLVGMDETANFVCRLPKRVETVEEAHEVLRPEGLLPHAKRQGEWFFTPVREYDKAENCACGKPLTECGKNLSVVSMALSSRSGVTTHLVRQFSHRGVTFAKGLVEDNRKGRHAPVDLGDTWHRVDRNTEQVIQQKPIRESLMQQAARRYD